MKVVELVFPIVLLGITTEIPPSKFNSDISTNVAMVLSKHNNKSPIDLAENLSVHIKKNDPLIENISIIKPPPTPIKEASKPVIIPTDIGRIIEM